MGLENIPITYLKLGVSLSQKDGATVVLTRTARGLDSRYMISRLKPPNVNVLSLTTIASPHRGF